MGLFLNVKVLAGDAVVMGAVRPCVFDDGSLTIKGVTLQEAMAVLKVLGGSSIDTASLSGVLPATSLTPSSQGSPQAEANRAAGWRSAEEALREGPQQAVQAPAVAPPAVAPSAPAAPPAAPVQRVDSGPSNPPVADPFTPPATSSDDLPPQAPANTLDSPPDEVLRAQTLRPVVAWLHEAGTEPTVAAMLPRVRALIAKMPPGPLTKGLTDDELSTRIKSTLERAELLKS